METMPEVLPEALPMEEREKILEAEISKYVKLGWRVANRANTSAQLVRDKKASCIVALVLALFLIVPAVLYLLLYRGTESLYIEVDEKGVVRTTTSQ